jgi:hypothetical protein
MGWQWEDDFKTECERLGFSCHTSTLNNRHDFTINNLRVQCKFTNASPKVDIRNKDKTSGRRYKKDAFDFLALRVHPMDATFIIPIAELVDVDGERLKQIIDVNEYYSHINNYGVFNASQNLPEVSSPLWTEDSGVQDLSL